MGKIFSVFLIVLVAAAFFGLKGEELVVDSPIPAVFGTTKEAVLNSWFPKSNEEAPAEFSFSSKSVLLVDYDSGEVLFSKEPDLRLPVASTVKIMTALVALDMGELNEVFTVSEKAAKVGENSMFLTTGEKLTLEELLYGMMLVSGNDAAVTVAEGITGNEEVFVKMMNEKAVDLGLKDTKFINASGLDEDAEVQYSTAHDMVVFAHHLWENYPKIREISSTYNKFIEVNESHKAFDLYNDTNLLTTYPGVRGIKPGFTWEAGLCLVTYAENDGRRLLGVILGSNDRRGEMKELLDYGFGKYGIKVDHPGLDL